MGAGLRAVAAAPPVALADVHIGIEKTGSSAIQAFLRANREVLLREHGVLFPRSLGGRLSANLAAACQSGEQPDDLRKIRGLLTDDALQQYRRELKDRLRAEIGREQPRRLVISCEHLSSRLPRRQDIARLRDFLSPLAVGVRVWVYLRRQDEFQLSLYSTAVRSGRCTPFRWPERGRERSELHYDRTLETWAGVFGEGNLKVRLFEAERLVGGDIVSDFCTALDLPGNLPRVTERVNASLNTRQIEYLRAINVRLPRFIGNEANPLRGDLARAAAALPLDGAALAAGDEAARYLERFARGNREVARRWFADDGSVPGELFEAPRPVATSPATGGAVSLQESLEAASHLWSHAQRQLIEQRHENETLRAELALERGQLQRARRLLTSPDGAKPEDERRRELFERVEREETLRDSRGGSPTPPAHPPGTARAAADRHAG